MSTKPDLPNGDGYAYNFDRRLDRINDTITNLVDAIVEEHKFREQDRKLFHDTMQEMRTRHIENMQEMREMLILQREHRIDIMALFQPSKGVKARLDLASL